MGKEPVDYVESWLKDTYAELQKYPESDLHYFTNQNFFGKPSKWGKLIDKVYLEPHTIEELLLRNEVHQILLTAFHNVMKMTEKLKPGRWNMGYCMEILDAYHLAMMIGQVDPARAVQMKIRLNALCRRFQETLEYLPNRTLPGLIGPITTQW